MRIKLFVVTLFISTFIFVMVQPNQAVNAALSEVKSAHSSFNGVEIDASAYIGDQPNAVAGNLPTVSLARVPFNQPDTKSSRTGRLYESYYRQAGLNYTDAQYHPTLHTNIVSLPAAERAAIDFELPYGTSVFASANGTIQTDTNDIDRTNPTHPIECGIAETVDGGPSGELYYVHTRPELAPGTHVTAGQRIGTVIKCGIESGANLHIAFWHNNREYPLLFADVAAQTSNGHTCPAQVICPSAGYAVFKYPTKAAPPSVTPTPVTPTPVTPTPVTPTPVTPTPVANAFPPDTKTSFNAAQGVYAICSPSLNQEVYLALWRQGAGWTYSTHRHAGESCAYLSGLQLNHNTLYVMVAALTPVTPALAQEKARDAQNGGCLRKTSFVIACDAVSW